MDLNEIFVFAKVVEAGSFVGAGRLLGMPKSTVSRKVSDLEARLGARLIQRTTRKLHLTDVGRTYLRYAARVVAEVEGAELAVTQMQEAPRGLLRVTTPLNVAYFGPLVAAFLERYPETQIELVCTDRLVDLVGEGFDVGLRAGHLADSTLIARNLGTIRNVVVASPAFLDQHGTPEHPDDLERFDCVAFGSGPERTRWRLRRGDESCEIPINVRLTVNDFDFLDEATRAGVGIATLPVGQCISHLREGRLRRVLPEWCSYSVPLQAVYPSTRHLSPKVKAFLDHLSEQTASPPWELSS